MSSVRAQIIEILDTSALSDPREIAEKLIGDIPSRQLRAALAEVLPQYVRVLMTNDRRSDPGRHSQPGSQTRSAPGSERWRAAAGVLASRFCPAGEWKPLRDCTRDDVLALVAERRDLAAKNAAVADQFERLHQLMSDRGVSTVGELAEAEVEGVLR